MNRFSSIFSQILQLFPRLEFHNAVIKTQAERHARGFSCWGQFVAMLFCQLGRAHSLREICSGLASCEGKLTHLGIKAPSRSTLAYANEHRPRELYQLIFFHLLDVARSINKKFDTPRKFSVISLIIMHKEIVHRKKERFYKFGGIQYWITESFKEI